MLPEARKVVVGLYAAGYEYGEIAEMLGVHVSTVRSHMSNARKYLRRVLPGAGEGKPAGRCRAGPGRVNHGPFGRKIPLADLSWRTAGGEPGRGPARLLGRDHGATLPSAPTRKCQPKRKAR